MMEPTKKEIEENRVARRVLRAAYHLDAEKRPKLPEGVDPHFADNDPALVEVAGSDDAAHAAVELLMTKRLAAARTKSDFRLTTEGRRVAPSLDELALVLPLDAHAAHYEQHEAARSLLAFLHGYAIAMGADPWGLDAETAEQEGFPVGLFRVAARHLVNADFATYTVGGGASVITSTPSGERFALDDDEEELDRLFPIGPKSKTPRDASAPPVPATTLGRAPCATHIASVRTLVAGIIRDPEFQRSLARDLDELERSEVEIVANHKCVMMLAGATAEALLVDVLGRNDPWAKAAKEMGGRPWPDRASLEALIKMGRRAGVVAEDAEAGLFRMKFYRDSIHASAGKRDQVIVDAPNARAAISFLETVARDLDQAIKGGAVTTYEKLAPGDVPPKK